MKKSEKKINTLEFQVIDKKQLRKIVGGEQTVQVDQSKLDSVLNLIR